MRLVETAIPDVVLLEPRVFEDSRGFFMETYHRDRLRDLGISGEWVQDNHSRSRRGTLRGLHYQLRHPQVKLCRVVQGAVLDVAVDLRRGSPTFGKWTAELLSADNKRQIYIPAGFAHGFVVLSETADFLYKCDNYYRHDDEHGILWNDPDLGIPWDVPEPLLSDKDRMNPRLAELAEEDLPLYP